MPSALHTDPKRPLPVRYTDHPPCPGGVAVVLASQYICTETFLHSTVEPLQTTKVSTRSQDDVVVIVVFSRASGSFIPWSVLAPRRRATVWRRAFVESWASFSSTHDTLHYIHSMEYAINVQTYMASASWNAVRGWAGPWLRPGEKRRCQMSSESHASLPSDPQRAAGTTPRGARFDDQGSTPAKDSLSGWCGLVWSAWSRLAVWSSSHTELMMGRCSSADLSHPSSQELRVMFRLVNH